MTQDQILKTQEEREFWKSVCIAVASSSNSTRTYNMYEWADQAIKYYRERTKDQT